MGESFEDTVDQLAQVVQDIGYTDTHTEQLESPVSQKKDTENNSADESPEQQPPKRYVILVDAAAGPDLVLLANENERYVKVQSSYPLWREIADAMSKERAEELVTDELVENPPEEHPIRSILHPEHFEDSDGLRKPIAAIELLDQVNTEVRRELVYQLSDIFSNAEVKHVVDSPSDSGAPHGFNVYYKIFPYEDDFSVSELNEVIERVRMAAHRGTQFLRYAFNLGVDISRTTGGEIMEEPNPPTEEIDPDTFSEASITNNEE
jgi:hypothetical protein